MPLITCPDCQREISDSAPACPGCGRPMALTASERLVNTPYVRRSRFSFLALVRRLLVVLLIIAGIWYAMTMWAADRSLKATGEKLGREMGNAVIGELSRSSSGCETNARIDSVQASTDGFLSKTGSVSVYISGALNRAVALEYRMELAGEKVYLKPKDQPNLVLLITQFALSDCE